jgi:hypothetical protein
LGGNEKKMAITNGQPPDARDVRNIKTYSGDVNIAASNDKKIYVHIMKTTPAPQITLYLYGEAGNMALKVHNHNHNHGGNTGSTVRLGGGTGHTHTITGDSTNAGDVVNATDVPEAVQIWIDGTEYTATIGDPNGKGATMYDSVNDDWGVDGVTEWSTGMLDLTGVIGWTAGEHYIEFKETGGTGGRLLWSLYVNNNNEW